MTRDMDLLRQLVLFLEKHDNVDSYSIEIDGYGCDEIAYHCLLLRDQGFLDHPFDSHHCNTYEAFFIRRLTNDGHDFARQIKDDAKWKVAKSLMSLVRQWTIPVLVDKLQEMTSLGWDQRMTDISAYLESLSQ